MRKRASIAGRRRARELGEDSRSTTIAPQSPRGTAIEEGVATTTTGRSAATISAQRFANSFAESSPVSEKQELPMPLLRRASATRTSSAVGARNRIERRRASSERTTERYSAKRASSRSITAYLATILLPRDPPVAAADAGSFSATAAMAAGRELARTAPSEGAKDAAA